MDGGARRRAQGERRTRAQRHAMDGGARRRAQGEPRDRAQRGTRWMMALDAVRSGNRFASRRLLTPAFEAAGGGSAADARRAGRTAHTQALRSTRLQPRLSSHACEQPISPTRRQAPGWRASCCMQWTEARWRASVRHARPLVFYTSTKLKRPRSESKSHGGQTVADVRRLRRAAAGRCSSSSSAIAANQSSVPSVSGQLRASQRKYARSAITS
jgi:hypothetical protein